MKTDIIVIFIYLIAFAVTMMSGDYLIKKILKKVFHLTDEQIYDAEEL